MKAILTSYLGGSYKVDGKRLPGPILTANGFCNQLKKIWPENARVLMICAGPFEFEKNDAVLYCIKEALPMSGFSAMNPLNVSKRSCMSSRLLFMTQNEPQTSAKVNVLFSIN